MASRQVCEDCGKSHTFWGALLQDVMRLVIAVGMFLALPLWLLLLKIISYLARGGGGRVVGKSLQTAIVSYEHSLTNQRVVLVGTNHIGDEAYFAHLRQRIGFLEASGYRVLYECVKGQSCNEKTGRLTDRERRSHEELDTVVDDLRNKSIRFSLLHQRDGLVYPQTWLNTDLSRSQLANMLLERRVRPPKQARWFEHVFVGGAGLFAKTRTLAKRLYQLWFDHFVFWSAIKPLVCRIFIRNDREWWNLAVHYRNEVAFRGICKSLQGNTGVVSIWGADHLRGIGKLLKGAGFRETEREWVVAVRRVTK